VYGCVAEEQESQKRERNIAFPLDLWVGVWYTRGMEKMIQAICEACDTVITFAATTPTPRFCCACEEDFKAHMDHTLGDADLEAWAGFWKAKERACEADAYDPQGERELIDMLEEREMDSHIEHIRSQGGDYWRNDAGEWCCG